MTCRLQGARRLARLLIATALLAATLVGCTQQPPLPRAVDTVDAFIRALNARDVQALESTFVPRDRRHWPVARLHRVLARASFQGRLARFRTVRTGAVPQAPDDKLRQAKSPAVTHAPYEITYWSRAARRRVTLKGALPVVFQRGRWGIAWSKSELWPGVKGAAAWKVVYRWP
ncbi:MAG: hypothetical protein QOD46_133, partial [Actinomycetota bacterium]|nr:hypothetical protein [Actinomycetota bacterium]